MKTAPIKRTIRTLLQFVVAGGLTAIVNEIADGLSPSWKAAVQCVNLLLVTFAQNWLEDNTSFPAVLKPSPPAENPVP